MTDLIGKRVRVNRCASDECRGLIGKVVGESVVGDDWSLVEFGAVDGGRESLHNTWFDIIEEDSMKDSLTNLQKLCTANNIHILISKESSEGSYQIWDEYSDDTYEMNNVEDVMKAIEYLNELKKWRQ